MKKGGQKIHKIISIFLALLYFGVVSWMFYDIMHRETVVSHNANVLVMGTNATFKPFEYKEGDKVVGFDVELASEIAKEMGAELKIEDMSFDGLLPALESGQIDLAVAGMSVTEERAKNALFSDSYYVASQQIIVKEKASSVTVMNWSVRGSAFSLVRLAIRWRSKSMAQKLFSFQPHQASCRN